MPATPLRRRVSPQLKGDEREAALVSAAERLLAEGGFEAASVATLAAAAGVSRPTFYFYFASKDALLASVVDATHADIARRLEDALRTQGTPTARLAKAMQAAGDAWWEHRAVMVAAMELAQRVPELGARMAAAMDRANALCTELLIDHGSVPERADPEMAAQLVRTLALVNERVFSFEVPAARSRRDLRAVEARLLAIWGRTMGLPDAGAQTDRPL